MDDCETLLKSRINEAYVKTLGQNIEMSIIDSFDRKNRKTIDEIKDICKDFSTKLTDGLTSTDETLEKFRNDLAGIHLDLELRASKKDVVKLKIEQEDAISYIQVQVEAAKNTVTNGQQKIESYGRLVQHI